MLPAEKNERLMWRVGMAVLIIMALYIVIWVVRTAYRSLHRIHDAYNVDVGRAPVVEPMPVAYNSSYES